MSRGHTRVYDLDAHIAEVYDQVETESDDVQLIRALLGRRKGLRILEPFCGTGRILIPLAGDGHQLIGLDEAEAMLARARAKIERLPKAVQERITLRHADVTTSTWPGAFDVVILGGNCFYELATPEEQEGCIVSAGAALRPGGHVYIDNDHMEGELEPGWREPGAERAFPTGLCADGVRIDASRETVWCDVKTRLVRFRRRVTVTAPDGGTTSREWIQQKHPVSAEEVKVWLEKEGFTIEELYGDRAAGPYHQASPRAIFWARAST